MWEMIPRIQTNLKTTIGRVSISSTLSHYSYVLQMVKFYAGDSPVTRFFGTAGKNRVTGKNRVIGEYYIVVNWSTKSNRVRENSL